MKLRYFLTLLVILFASTGLVLAIEDETEEIPLRIEETEPIKGNIFKSDYMTGNWFGLRNKLVEKGIDIQSSYIISPIQSIPTSTARKADPERHSKMSYKGLFNLSAEVDTEKMNLYKGGKFFVLYQAANKGISPNSRLNSYLTIDSLDTSDKSISQLSEYWYEQEFLDKFSIKIGKQDANTDFQNIDCGFEFVNLSFSYIPTTPIPFYPAGQMGLRLKYDINEKYTVQNGFYSGSGSFGSSSKSFFKGNEGYFDIAQLTYNSNFKNHEGKYHFGGWVHTADVEKLSNSRNLDNNHGFYFMAEQNLFKEKEGAGKEGKEGKEGQGLNLIAQTGWSPKDRNIVNRYFGLGLLYRGLIPKRDYDTTGISLGVAGFSNDNPNTEKTFENLLEIFYKFQVTKWLSVQPDFQYIIHPNATSGSSFAFGIRSNWTF